MRLIDELLKDDFFHGGYHAPTPAAGKTVTPPSSPSRKKLVIIGVSVVAVLGAVGAGGFFYFNSLKNNVPARVEAVAPPAPVTAKTQPATVAVAPVTQAAPAGVTETAPVAGEVSATTAAPVTPPTPVAAASPTPAPVAPTPAPVAPVKTTPAPATPAAPTPAPVAPVKTALAPATPAAPTPAPLAPVKIAVTTPAPVATPAPAPVAPVKAAAAPTPVVASVPTPAAVIPAKPVVAPPAAPVVAAVSTGPESYTLVFPKFKDKAKAEAIIAVLNEMGATAKLLTESGATFRVKSAKNATAEEAQVLVQKAVSLNIKTTSARQADGSVMLEFGAFKTRAEADKAVANGKMLNHDVTVQEENAAGPVYVIDAGKWLVEEAEAMLESLGADGQGVKLKKVR